MASNRYGKWIWTPNFNDHDAELPGRFVIFCKEITLSHVPTQSCLVNVSADTRYRLYVNGRSVAFGPCKSYPARWYYETIDVAPYLVEGRNILTARVLRFFPGQVGSSSMMKANIPGFILWGSIGDMQIGTDQTWSCREDRSVRLRPRSRWNFILGPPFLSLDEDVDCSLAQENELDTSQEEPKWYQAVPAIAAVKMMPVVEPWKLHPRPIPLLPELPKTFDSAVRCSDGLQLSEWNALLQQQEAITIPPRALTWVEFQSNLLTTGFIELEFDKGNEGSIELLYAESYEKDLGVDTAPFPRPRHKQDRTDHATGRLYGTIDRIHLSASTVRYEPFWFRTFRFIRMSITTNDKPLRIRKVAFRETQYPLNVTVSLSLPTDLQQIWDICINTLQNCMHETYEDCPFYEQNQFAMDSRLQMLFTYNISRDDRLARKTIHEFYASRRGDGLLETNFPMSFNAINIPQFSLFWILMLHDHMLYFNEKSLVKRYISTADDILYHFEQRLNQDNLVGAFDPDCWAFIDWVKEWHGTTGIRDMAVPPAYKRTGVATYNSLLYAYILQRAAELCDFIGRYDTGIEYRSRADKITTAVNKHCFNTTFYLDGPGSPEISQHSQIFAILAGAISGDEAVSLMHRTMMTPMPQCSFAMKHYVFRALEVTGLYEMYFEQMMEPWRQMVKENLTTCAEDDVGFRSDCHGWSANPIFEFVAGVYGVKPVMGSGRRWEIRPKRELIPDGVCEVDVEDGRLKAEWQRGQDERVEIKGDVERWETTRSAGGWSVATKDGR